MVKVFKHRFQLPSRAFLFRFLVEGYLLLFSIVTFHTPGLRGINIQATWCVLGGKSRVKDVTLFLTTPVRKTLNEAKGGIP